MGKNLSIWMSNADLDALNRVRVKLQIPEASLALKKALHQVDQDGQPEGVPGTFDIVETDVGRALRLEREEQQRKEIEKQAREKVHEMLYGKRK